MFLIFFFFLGSSKKLFLPWQPQCWLWETPFLIVFRMPRLKEHFCRDQFFLRNHLFNICYLITLLQRTNILKWQMIIVLSQWSELILKPGLPKGCEHVNWSSCLVLGDTSYCLRKQGGCCRPADLSPSKFWEHESSPLGRRWGVAKWMFLQIGVVLLALLSFFYFCLLF